jgi:hypothetical protein
MKAATKWVNVLLCFERGFEWAVALGISLRIGVGGHGDCRAFSRAACDV